MPTDRNDPRLAATDAFYGDATAADAPRQRPRRRTAAVPITPDLLAGAPEFAPVPRKLARYDGWTYPRQRAFVKLLAETGCVDRACRALGMSTVGVYLLRKAAGGEGFAAAWEEAQGIGVQRLSDIAFDRAIHGTPRGVYYQGEKVAEERRYNDRLLMFTLRHHDPETYGASITDTNRVPPHIRRKLRAEWEREEAEKLSGMYGGLGPAGELARRLDLMAERMGEE